MPYAKFHDTWQDFPLTTTLISAEALNHMESGIQTAQAAAEAAQTSANTKAPQTALDDHIGNSTSVHGIADTSVLETQSGAQAKADAAQSAAESTAATDATNKANTAQANAVQRANHTGTQPMSTITETATGKIMSDTERTKLTSVKSGAEAGIVVREYDSVTGWPVRGAVGTDGIVMWINRVNNTPPSAGGDGYLDEVDVILVVANA